MKRLFSATGTLLLLVAVTTPAQASRIGAHGVYSTGGDIEESKAGFGGQLELSINPMFSIELAVSNFIDEFADDDDEAISIEQELTSVGLSAIFRAPLAPHLQAYALVGANYNTVEMELIEKPDSDIDIDSDFDLDDEVGFHAAAGLNLGLQDNLEFFGEYRYTVLELEGEMSASVTGQETVNKTIAGDYNFGLLKIGVNLLF